VAIPALAVRGGHVIRVPEGVDASRAALAEPLNCAVNACLNSGVSCGDTVLVMGAGPMGILNGLAARASGAAKVIISETNPARLRGAPRSALIGWSIPPMRIWRGW